MSLLIKQYSMTGIFITKLGDHEQYREYSTCVGKCASVPCKHYIFSVRYLQRLILTVNLTGSGSTKRHASRGGCEGFSRKDPLPVWTGSLDIEMGRQARAVLACLPFLLESTSILLLLLLLRLLLFTNIRIQIHGFQM